MSGGAEMGRCAACGGPFEDDLNWPSSDDRGDICFACWEAECDRSWWEEMSRIEVALVGLTYRTFLSIARSHALRIRRWRTQREIGASNAG